MCFDGDKTLGGERAGVGDGDTAEAGALADGAVERDGGVGEREEADAEAEGVSAGAGRAEGGRDEAE